MTDRELLEQMVHRSINNILSNVNPNFRMFSSTLTNYAMEFMEPYIKAFTSVETGHVNADAAQAYLKDETSKKIEDFMNKFKEDQDK